MPTPHPQTPWWNAGVHADRRPLLLARGRVMRALRGWFEAQDFVEVDASALQVSPGNEAHLHAFRTELVEPDASRRPLYLHTSPEFACKKLLAAGESRIFTFAQVFRNRERGALHHPAFTMLEWYRAGEPYERVMEDCAALLAVAAEAVGASALRFGTRAVDPSRDARAADRSRGLHPVRRHRPPRHRPSIPEGGNAGLRSPRRAGAGIRVADDDTWGDVFSRVLVEKVEPQLGNGRATLLTRVSSSACRARPAKAERPPRGRALRALRLRCGAGQCLRRADRPRPAARAARGGDGREGAPSRASATPSTRTSSPRLPTCRPRAAPRSASIAWSCWQPALHASSR